jgi:hypothetical protein
MNQRQIASQIAAFKGCSTEEARQKAKTFAKHCAVPLSKVNFINLSFGMYSDSQMHYYGENRDTLHFVYTTTDKERYNFSILD